MEIKTKFNVGDLTKKIYDSNSKGCLFILQVLEVISNTCYAGTQVFYLCRVLTAKKEYEHEYKKEGDFIWAVYHSTNTDPNKMGWHKYREDELIKASEGEQSIIKGLLVGESE